MGVFQKMMLKIIAPIITCLLACLTFWAALDVWLIAFHARRTVDSFVLAWGGVVLLAIGCLIIVGGYLALKPKPVGRHGVRMEP